jgi:hypothetical protein
MHGSFHTLNSGLPHFAVWSAAIIQSHLEIVGRRKPKPSLTTFEKLHWMICVSSDLIPPSWSCYVPISLRLALAGASFSLGMMQHLLLPLRIIAMVKASHS